ncbi:hypothetical protein NJD71_12735 [Psychrobacter sp. PP-21]|uniref:hypothetical protein n=1 Tax=Psychrobacter sp. PP-21 TaxID=2957503 RepID=UPI0029A64452|nr:hypothetical protein [Psychrobacter sp. PP-21]MDX2374984.1 hypothetical protein [Psychrobacter sp. PP-21]
MEIDIEHATDGLIPNLVDNHQSVRKYFLTVAALSGQGFMNLSLPETEKDSVLSKIELKAIYKGCTGRLTNDHFRVTAFIGSTYHLKELDISNPAPEWLWISKLCQLLLYCSDRELMNRITEITTFARLWIVQGSSYHHLWQKCLELQSKGIAPTFENIDAYKQHLDDIKSTDLNQFAKVHRALKFVLHNKNRIERISTKGRKSRETRRVDEEKIEYIEFDDVDDDSDELISVTEFLKTDNDIDVVREKLDIGLPDFTILKQTSLQAHEKYSAQQIYHRTRSKLQHANKNERLIGSNVRILPLFALQNIFAHLWQLFEELSSSHDRDKKRAVSYLLLSMFTGRSVVQLSEDVTGNNKQYINLNRRNNSYHLNIILDITPLRLRTQGIQKVLANRLLECDISLPEQLGTFLAYKGNINKKILYEVINETRGALKLPYLSLARIEKGLYSILIHHVSNSQVASIITGRNERKRADIWYSSNSVDNIRADYQQAIKLLSQKTTYSNDYLSPVSNTIDYKIGSQNCPDYTIVSDFINLLCQKVDATTDYIEKFNAYSIWLWHVSLLLTSVRAVEGAPGYLDQFNFGVGLIWISDKEERATASSQRYVPLCQFLSEAINRYIDFLKSFASRFCRLDMRIKWWVDEVMDYERPLINLFNKKGELEAIRPALVRNEIHENFKFKEDWTRHVGQRYLHEQNINESMILSVFGHEMMGQESWRKNSSISIGDILDLRPTYQALANKLKIRQVQL